MVLADLSSFNVLFKKILIMTGSESSSLKLRIGYSFLFVACTSKISQQCCGTVNICCGSGSDFGKVLVPVPDPDNIEHSFPTTKNLHKVLPLQCQNQLYFPESCPLMFDFLTFLFHLM